MLIKVLLQILTNVRFIFTEKNNNVKDFYVPMFMNKLTKKYVKSIIYIICKYDIYSLHPSISL